jgi:hypothetical protein
VERLQIGVADAPAWRSIDSRHAGSPGGAILEFLFGWDGDVAQDGASELGKEAFDKFEP